MILLVAPMVLAEADVETSHTFKQGMDVSLCIPCLDPNANICDGTETVSISIKDPHGGFLTSSQVMTSNATDVCYPLSAAVHTNKTGIHEYTVNYQHPTNPSGNSVISYRVTATGEVVSGIAIVFFSIFFFVILGWMIYSIINVIGHFVKTDMDLADLMKVWIGYFVLLGFYGMALLFFNSTMVIDFLEMFIDIGQWTHIYFPLLALILSMSIGAWKKSRPTDSDEDFHYEY